MDSKEILYLLLDRINAIKEVESIGITGKEIIIPEVGKGDFDIFIYCSKIPDFETRDKTLIQLGNKLDEIKINVFEQGHWGQGDFALINGIDTWMMYFTPDEVTNKVESYLSGEYPDRLDNYYYPTGLLAMLKDIKIIYDKNNFLSLMKERLDQYPEKLSHILSKYHLEQLEDTEDLLRAVNRKDVLFYHFALDLSIDHFLQALFALNKTYFPSRKRSMQFIKNFTIKPNLSEEKILEVIKLGSCSESIESSYKIWFNLCQELKLIFSCN